MANIGLLFLRIFLFHLDALLTPDFFLKLLEEAARRPSYYASGNATYSDANHLIIDVIFGFRWSVSVQPSQIPVLVQNHLDQLNPGDADRVENRIMAVVGAVYNDGGDGCQFESWDSSHRPQLQCRDEIVFTFDTIRFIPALYSLSPDDGFRLIEDRVIGEEIEAAPDDDETSIIEQLKSVDPFQLPKPSPFPFSKDLPSFLDFHNPLSLSVLFPLPEHPFVFLPPKLTGLVPTFDPFLSLSRWRHVRVDSSASYSNLPIDGLLTGVRPPYSVGEYISATMFSSSSCLSDMPASGFSHLTDIAPQSLYHIMSGSADASPLLSKRRRDLLLAGRRIFSHQPTGAWFNWDAVANPSYWRIVRRYLHSTSLSSSLTPPFFIPSQPSRSNSHTTPPQFRSSRRKIPSLSHLSAYCILKHLPVDDLLPLLPSLHEGAVISLLSVIGWRWGCDPHLLRTSHEINFILAHLIALLILPSPFTLQRSDPHPIKLDLFAHGALFWGLLPFNDSFVQEFSRLCIAASSAIAHLSLRWCKRLSSADGIALLLRVHRLHLVTVDLSHSLVDDHVIVDFFSSSLPMVLQTLDLHSTIIGVDALIAMHRYIVVKFKQKALSLRLINIRNCQRLFFFLVPKTSKKSFQMKEKFLRLLIDEMISCEVEILY